MNTHATLGAVEILERLVGFPTVSRDSNLPLIDWVRNFLQDYGIRSHLVLDRSGRKSNLIASIGPEREGGLMLSGHTDVVPVDGQAWSSDPFTLTAREGRLHGRGACDMKGFIAAALSRAVVWKSSQLSRPVHLMLSYDEELAKAAASLCADPIAVPFTTEGGQFQRAGWSTVVCGPGSIEQAHKPDEFIERTELAACQDFLDRAVARQCR